MKTQLLSEANWQHNFLRIQIHIILHWQDWYNDEVPVMRDLEVVIPKFRENMVGHDGVLYATKHLFTWEHLGIIFSSLR